jgi:hypothetical protein
MDVRFSMISAVVGKDDPMRREFDQCARCYGTRLGVPGDEIEVLIGDRVIKLCKFCVDSDRTARKLAFPRRS